MSVSLSETRPVGHALGVPDPEVPEMAKRRQEPLRIAQHPPSAERVGGISSACDRSPGGVGCIRRLCVLVEMVGLGASH